MLVFLQKIIQYLNRQKIPYMLSGSIALSIYTVPRATRDFDFIVHLLPKNIASLISTFRESYFCDEEAVKDAIEHRSMFNIIDHASGFKANFVLLKDEPYRQTEFKRRIKADFFEIPIFIVTPEDLLISKLIWIQEMKSTIQMEDIKNLALIETLDWEYINYWLKKLNLNTFKLI
jgi:hypothetical protein